MTRNYSFLLIFTSVLFLTACSGGYVDEDGGSFVDTESAGGFDRENAPRPASALADSVVVNTTSKDFVPPPQSVQGSASTRYEESFVGKNAVAAWVWNDRGSQKLFIPDGSRITLENLGVTLEVVMIAPSADTGSAVVLAIDGTQLPALHVDEEIRTGRTYVYITEILLK